MTRLDAHPISAVEGSSRTDGLTMAWHTWLWPPLLIGSALLAVTRHGDVFAFGCIGLSGIALAGSLARGNSNTQRQPSVCSTAV